MLNKYRPCVGIILLNKDKKILVGERIDSERNSLFSWQMPQGGIDKNESPINAALRELKEEIGTNNVSVVFEYEPWLEYKLPIDLAKKLWEGKYIGQKQKWFLMKFLGDDNEINIKTEIPEFKNWKWVRPDELISLAVPFKRDIYKTLVEKVIPVRKSL